MRRCVAYIPDSDSTMTFDLMVKYIGFLSCLCVWSITSDCFDIGIPYLAKGSITMRECVAYVHNPYVSLTFDLKVKFIGLMTRLCVRATAFMSFDSHTMFGT